MFLVSTFLSSLKILRIIEIKPQDWKNISAFKKFCETLRYRMVGIGIKDFRVILEIFFIDFWKREN